MERMEKICKMAVLGCTRNPQAHTTEECMKCEFKRGMCDVYKVAEKILENNVVLTFDEWINFNKDHANELIKAREDEYELGYNTARKETASDFAKKLKKVIHERDYVEGYAYLGICEEIDELAKKYGVEVEKSESKCKYFKEIDYGYRRSKQCYAQKCAPEVNCNGCKSRCEKYPKVDMEDEDNG